MVIGRYRRSISFPNLNPITRPSKSHHVRSISLPCSPTHPSISKLNQDISLLLSWPHSEPIHIHPNTTSSWLVNGLTHLNTIINSLNHLLQTPLPQPSSINTILDHSLFLLDAFATFHSSLLALKHDLSSAQVSLRRRKDDTTSLISYLKVHNKASKEMAKLLRSLNDFSPYFGDESSDEISIVIRDVLGVTKSVSVSVFESVLALVGPTTRIRVSTSWVGSVVGLRRKRGDEELKGELKRMEEMEECIEGLEIACGRVLRSLITTRVSLLNMLTRSLL